MGIPAIAPAQGADIHNRQQKPDEEFYMGGFTGSAGRQIPDRNHRKAETFRRKNLPIEQQVPYSDYKTIDQSKWK